MRIHDLMGSQALLGRLWSAGFQTEEAMPRAVKAKRWKDMGWQSDDPGRDFRCAACTAASVGTVFPGSTKPVVPAGLPLLLSAARCCGPTSPSPCHALDRGGGLLSLEALVFAAEEHPDTFRSLMLKQDGQRSKWEYPFAAAGVNLTFMLVGKAWRRAGLPAV